MRKLEGQRVAVFADLPLSIGLVALLQDLGVETVLIGIRGTSLGGEAKLMEGLERAEVSGTETMNVIEHPSIRQAAEHVYEYYSTGQIDGVLCSATELNGITRVFADHRPELDTLGGRGLFYLEIGFPSQSHHTAVPQPFMGYGGVVALAQRLFDAPRLYDPGRD